MEKPNKTEAVKPDQPRMLVEDANAAVVQTEQGQKIIKTQDREKLAEQLDVENKDI